MFSSVSSSSVGVVAGRSTWGTGSVGAIIEDRCVVTLDSLSGFISKVDEMVATIGDCGPCSGWCPPDVKICDFIDIF